VDALPEAAEDLRRISYHFTHHLLHAWIPRRLFTDRLDPWRQLEGEPSGFVWFAEGFAQYLAFVGLARTGALSPVDALRMMAARFAIPLQENIPPTPVTMTGLSRVLCEGDHSHWRYNYALGGLLALWLDLKLHDSGRPGLPEAMLRLFEQHAPGIPEDHFEAALSQSSGFDATVLFAAHVRGPEPLPISQILGAIGAVHGGSRPLIAPDPEVSPEIRRRRERLLSPPHSPSPR
jgi:predicted metalloprotease with PDZ domain